MEISTTRATEIRGEFIHVFDAATFDTLLARLDTAPDLIAYLTSKEKAFREQHYVVEGEENLLAAYLYTTTDAGEYEMPGTVDRRPTVRIPDLLWAEYLASDRFSHSQRESAFSYCIDRIVEQFAQDVRDGAPLIDPLVPLNEHERAFRYLVSESRFGRQIVAGGLKSIIDEGDTKTFWMATMPSHARTDIRYVWVTYPQFNASVPLEKAEDAIRSQLGRYMVMVARKFPARVTIGIAVPNPRNKMTTYFVQLLGEGTIDSFPPTEPFENLTEQTRMYFD